MIIYLAVFIGLTLLLLSLTNNDYINRNVDIMFANRKSACEELNKKFGLNVKVTKNNNFENSYDQNGEEEGEIDE